MKAQFLKLAGALALLGSLAACALPAPGGAAQAPAPTPVAPAPDRIVADAIVIPARGVEVAFESDGTVAEVLVQEGDVVAAGAPLARLDTSDLELRVAEQRAGLAQAEAAYRRLIAGATEAEVAAQQAALRNAQAQLERARSGNVTEADIASAQAQLRSATARLEALRNPSPASQSAAQLAVTQAQSSLESTRTNASAAKTNAELAMRQAGDSLTRAQASYATAKENWDFVRETGQDPTNPETRLADGKEVKNRLNDVQERQYYEAFVQAEASLRSAEKEQEQARVSYDAARQDEAIQVRQAEEALANAARQLEALTAPTASDLAQAQAEVDQARASLRKLQQGGTAPDVAAAQAAVDQAQANLEQLTAPPRDVDLAEARARVDAAQVALQQAERGLSQATLAAPFAGVVAERNLEVGQRVSASLGASGAAAFVLADTGAWKVETDNLGERDVVRLADGAPARITFAALPDLTITGRVTSVQPRGVDRYGDITYTVTVTPDTWDERLRWNMSASVSIEPTAP
jgi:HlyD family secretion protein